MAGGSYLIDSNILIRWVQPDHPEFQAVRSAIQHLEDSEETLCYTSQNLGEFWNVLTRPANRNGYGLTAEGALFRAQELESKFQLLADRLAVHMEWRRLLVDYAICGVQVHDARLVAAMLVHGVKRILTFNTRDFARFSGIEAIHPADLKTNP
jgi:predicted nucleic acid-binding protein